MQSDRAERYKQYILTARTELDLCDQNELNLDSQGLIDHMTKIIQHMTIIRQNAPEFCKNVTLMYLVRAYMHRAWVFIEREQYLEALADYLVANKLVPRNEDITEALVECYHALGHLSMMKNDFQTAVDYYSRAEKLGSSNEELVEQIQSNLADCKKFVAEHKELVEQLQAQARASGIVEFHDASPHQDSSGIVKPKPRKAEKSVSEPQPLVKKDGSNDVVIGRKSSSFTAFSPKPDSQPRSPDADPAGQHAKKNKPSFKG